MPPAVTPQIPVTAPAVGRGFAPPPAKKKSNVMLPLTIAAIVGLMAIGAVRMFSAPKPAETVKIVSAGKDIPAGCRINFASLHYTNLPKAYYKEGMFTSYEQVVGKYSRTFLPAREPISTNEVVAGLPLQLPRGYRAIAIKLTNDAMVDSQVRPGDRVDVVATSSYNSKKYTRTICQNLLVMLSTPKETLLSENARSDENNLVTLAANPAEAEVLSEAVENSKLRLTLRSQGDLSLAVLQGSDERDLLPHEALRQEPPVLKAVEIAPPPPPAAPVAEPAFGLPPVIAEPAKWVVEMFSGSRRENLEVNVRQ